jgi:two-component system phosphate regulon response regulator PhoB
MQTILVIEDEQELAELVALRLQQQGYRCFTACDGIQGLEMARRYLPNLILLDPTLPGMVGTELCKLVKGMEATRHIPVIMLSAKSDESSRIQGFEAGADDYLVKPYSLVELMLRVNAVLRSYARASEAGSIISIGAVTIDALRHAVAVDGEEGHFTDTEFKLLHTLVKRRGRVLSRDVLLRDVWGISSDSEGRTVDTHITRLRGKMGKAGKMIKTVRGFGYKLENL